MAKAKKLPSGSWRCLVYDYTNSDKKRIYKSFTSSDTSPAGKRRAEYLAAEYVATKERVATKTELTFKQGLEQYISERSSILSPASIRKYKSMQKNYSELDELKIYDINQSIFQVYINNLSAKNKSPKTVQDYVGLAKSTILRFCPDNMFRTVLPKKTKIIRKIPADEDIQKIVTAIKGTDMEVPVYLGAYAIMRRGEISALTKSDIFENTIHIAKTMVLNSDSNWVIKAPKSYAGNRIIKVPQFVIEAFMKLPNETINMTPNIITSKFEHILKQSGVEHFRFHDLRHYSASIRHALGVPDAYIMADGGWGDDRVLKDVYRHVMDAEQSRIDSISINHFDAMQHEMQHGIKKVP